MREGGHDRLSAGGIVAPASWIAPALGAIGEQAYPPDGKEAAAPDHPGAGSLHLPDLPADRGQQRAASVRSHRAALR